MTGTLKERGIQAVGEHKGRVVVEGFIEEVAMELGLKGLIRVHQTGGIPPKLQCPCHPLATLSCDVGLDGSI